MEKKKMSFLSKLCFGIGAFGKDAVYAIVAAADGVITSALLRRGLRKLR